MFKALRVSFGGLLGGLLLAAAGAAQGLTPIVMASAGIKVLRSAPVSTRNERFAEALIRGKSSRPPSNTVIVGRFGNTTGRPYIKLTGGLMA